MSISTDTTSAEATNDTKRDEKPEAPRFSAETVRVKITATLNTLIDVGAAWVSTGLGYAKVTVENGARQLEKTAKTLESYQNRFKPGTASSE